MSRRENGGRTAERFKTSLLPFSRRSVAVDQLQSFFRLS